MCYAPSIAYPHPMAAVDPPPPRRRLLLATAHPDDESLFFVPALLRVGRGRGPLGGVVVVDVLCLSTGAWRGKRGGRQTLSPGRVVVFFSRSDPLPSSSS